MCFFVTGKMTLGGPSPPLVSRRLVEELWPLPIEGVLTMSQMKVQGGGGGG